MIKLDLNYVLCSGIIIGDSNKIVSLYTSIPISIMRNLNRTKVLAVFGSTSLFALVALMTVQSITASLSSTVPEGLEGLSIVPANPTVTAGESIRLSAEGDYGTNTMPIRADWLLPKEGMGTIGDCTNTKTCTFTAGDTPGTLSIQALIGDGKFSDMVDITIEQKKDVLVNPFTDELPEWAFEAIVRMHQKGIVKGYDDGRYGPGDPVTNGQVITLIHRILIHANLITDPKGCVQVYDDVPQGHYAFIPACTFRRQGWSSAEERLYPDEASPRGVTAGFMNGTLGETLLSAMGSRPPQGQAFDDVPMDHPHFNDTAVTNHTGLMTGYPSGDFGVNDDLNRAAVAVIMFRILNRIEGGRINVLEGYDASATDGHGAAPATAKAACMVNADHGGSPRAGDPELGDGYVKLHLMEDHDITSVRERCTGEFEALEARYCADARNRSNRFQRSVLIFNEDGSIRTGGGATKVSQYLECPGAEQESSSSSSSEEPAGPEDGDACDDGNLCTTDDVYNGGVCSGEPKVCDDKNVCTNDQCDANTGSCKYSANNLSCDDGDPATIGDACRSGKCVPGTPAGPADGDACDDGSACTTGDVYIDGVCSGEPKVCNDGNSCTTDRCDTKTGCAYAVNNGAACDDRNADTENDSCSAAGKCSGTPVVKAEPVDGACVLRAGNSPRGDAPDIGKDYVKKHIAGATDITSLRAGCTQDVYDTLLVDYCALGVNPEVQRGVATYRDDYSSQSSGCGSMGCEYISCPVNTNDILKQGMISVGTSPTFVDLQTGKVTSSNPDSTFDITAKTIVSTSRSCRRSGFPRRTRCTTRTQTTLSMQQHNGGKATLLNPPKVFKFVEEGDCKATLTRGGTSNPITISVGSSPGSAVFCVQDLDGSISALGEFNTMSGKFKTWNK